MAGRMPPVTDSALRAPPQGGYRWWCLEGIQVQLLGGLRAPRGCDLCAGNPPREYGAGSGMTRRASKGKAVTTRITALESTGAAEESRTPASSLGGRRATATPRPHQFRAPPLSSAAGAPAAHEHLLGKQMLYQLSYSRRVEARRPGDNIHRRPRTVQRSTLGSSAPPLAAPGLLTGSAPTPPRPGPGVPAPAR